jgi:single-strand DNA-binding protein
MRRKIEIVGYLTGDATVYTPQNNTNNRVCINFHVAVNEKFKDKQGAVTEKAYFFACAYWKPKDSIKIFDYLKKGTLVLVEGQPDCSMYQNKNNENVAQMKIEVKEVLLLSGKKDGQQGSTTTTNNSNDDDNGDLPF